MERNGVDKCLQALGSEIHDFVILNGKLSTGITPGDENQQSI